MQLDEAVEALYKLFCRDPSFHIALCRLDPVAASRFVKGDIRL